MKINSNVISLQIKKGKYKYYASIPSLYNLNSSIHLSCSIFIMAKLVSHCEHSALDSDFPLSIAFSKELNRN